MSAVDLSGPIDSHCHLQNLPEDALTRSGCGIDHDGSVINPRTVRALAYHIAGHELRHIKLIRERYLGETTTEGII